MPQERGCTSFCCSSLPTCHLALLLLFPSLEATLAREGEALLLSTPQPLPPFPVVGIFIGLLQSWGGYTNQVQMSRCHSASWVLPPRSHHVLSGCFYDCSRNHAEALFMCVSTRPVHSLPPWGKKVAVVDIHSVWRHKPCRNGKEAQQDERWDTGDFRGPFCAYKIILQVAELRLLHVQYKNIFCSAHTTVLNFAAKLLPPKSVPSMYK